MTCGNTQLQARKFVLATHGRAPCRFGSQAHHGPSLGEAGEGGGEGEACMQMHSLTRCTLAFPTRREALKSQCMHQEPEHCVPVHKETFNHSQNGPSAAALSCH
eukprot:3584565-Rhodomonas_salina.1